jgi:uncharacterized membrane protein
MTPKSKEIVAGASMLIFMVILLLIILSSTGCAPAIKNTTYAAHTGIDSSLTAAKVSQKQASRQIRMIEKAVSDPLLKGKVDNLNQTINELGAQLDATTGKISWYENQYQNLFADNATTHKNLDTAIAYGQSEHKANVAANKRADVVIYLFALFVAIAACKAAWRASVTPVSGFAGLIVPGACFVLAFASAYGFAYYTLNFLGRFLPDFSWLQHKI